MGNRVREIREQRGISVRKLAAEMGVSPSTLSRVETGFTRLSSHHIAQLSDLLGCKPEDLVTDDEPLTAEERQFLDVLRANPKRARRIIDLILDDE